VSVVIVGARAAQDDEERLRSTQRREIDFELRCGDIVGGRP